jgi:hypothetical protein
MGKAVTLALVALILAGCQTAGFCDAARAIRPEASDVDTMSDGLGRQVLAHNKTGQDLCGWQP